MEKRKLSKLEKIIIVFLIFLFVGALGGYFLDSYLKEPDIKLVGKSEVVISLGERYNDEGAIANLDEKDISDKIVVEGDIDSSKTGDYKLVYSVTNSMGKRKRKVERVVTVVDKESPVIKLKGKTNCVINFGNKYIEPGYTAIDAYEGDLTKKVKVAGSVDVTKLGTYKLVYTVSDSSSNTSKKTRVVKVVDREAPSIKLKGSKKITIDVGEKYVEPGYRAFDNYDNDITKNVYVSGKVNVSKAGSYEITYNITDSSGNFAYVSRVVQVGSQKDIDKDNYIMVSIRDQKLWYYKNRKLVLSSNIVSGTKGVHDTVTGAFRIRNKVAGTYLVGEDYKSWVNFWMLFDSRTQSGLHDATWRSSFGGSIYKKSGSHGCVNMPYSKAQSLFNKVDVGTLVTIY